MNPKLRLLGLLASHTLFWGWNLLFVSVLLLGIGPVLLFETVYAAYLGLIPWSVASYVPLLMALPLAGMALGLWKLRGDPGRLMSLFFGVQFPLMAIAFLRIFGLGQLVPSTTLMLSAFFIGAIALLRTLLSGFSEQTRWAQVLRLVGQSTYLWIGLWTGAFLGLYLVPTALSFADDLFRWPSNLHSFSAVLRELWFRAFVTFSIASFLVFPVAMVGITLRAWQLVQRESVRMLGAVAAQSISLLTVLGLTVSILIASHQPQHRAFELLDQATDDDGKRAAVQREEAIRRGLLNARLSSYRYLGDIKDTHIKGLYRRELGAWSSGPAMAVWRFMAWPVTYHSVNPVQWDDRMQATERYEAFFDAPMDRAERDEITRAMGNTWNWRQAAAGLLDVGEQRVWMQSQDIETTAHGDHATVMLHDVYRNNTWQNQEVFVSFSLPEDAVVTGLWLGATDDRSEAFTHVVAPRGAAQEVYEQQVRRRVDPALLEQVGPRQYRLRAYPVLGREGDLDELAGMADYGPELHVWMQIEVWGNESGWPLPQRTEVRNLFWDGHTQWSVNGETVSNPQDWTPDAVLDDDTLVNIATPIAGTSRPQRIAVYVDTSRSMSSEQEALTTALSQLTQTSEHTIEWLNHTPESHPFLWGNGRLQDELLALDTTDYDALIVLTDASPDDLSRDHPAPYSGAPLWMVHLGGLPHSYPDALLDGISATHGGIGTSVSDVLRQIEQGPTTHARPATLDASAGRLMAKQRAYQLIRDGGSLDEVHQLAVVHDLVTPWSSMIVLVNEAQMKLLAEASEASDRFDREAPQQSAFENPLTATPEPHEWVLMLLAGLMLRLRGRRPRGLAADCQVANGET